MPRLTDDAINRTLAGLEGWRREGDALARDFVLRDFVAALGFIVEVGALAERANHHPTITNTYNRVRLELSTHDEGGITERDVDLAREVNARR
ncbi:MAG: 4a-hydroxytetrahydrobiopterin dehydratase [Dehalococcoidia bacterium]